MTTADGGACAPAGDFTLVELSPEALAARQHSADLARARGRQIERLDRLRVTALAASLAGRTIQEAKLEGSGDGSTFPGELTLTLDDGRVITIGSWGHDWWGILLDEETEP